MRSLYDKDENTFLYITLVVVIVVSVAFNMTIITSMYDNNKKHIDSLMSYCEKVTGKSQASFTNGGEFQGCETVVR